MFWASKGDFSPTYIHKRDRSLKGKCTMSLVIPVFLELIDLIPCLIIIVSCEEIKIFYCSDFNLNVTEGSYINCKSRSRFLESSAMICHTFPQASKSP